MADQETKSTEVWKKGLAYVLKPERHSDVQ